VYWLPHHNVWLLQLHTSYMGTRLCTKLAMILSPEMYWERVGKVIMFTIVQP